MSQLTIYTDSSATQCLFSTQNATDISERLAAVGVRFEQWQTRSDIAAGDSQDTVLNAYASDVQRLIDQQGYQSVDVISIAADNPQKDALRLKFLDEHTHSEDEVRFFVQGQGLFALHIDNCVYEIHCEKGDLLSVPANTSHWFDLGPQPDLVAIRFFNNPDGWVANYTGNDIADRYSRLDTLAQC
ncbi:Acireductone dioxygenase [Zhongshania aliphaticivorans]|uniref:Acireductone dioxygenase n=1 Tax=Zhongshania aliphaticivorans TaxID=1470434 RepID=A0A5S9NL21_9GAMM|nr:cupin [Zhongshania aliphaticivorans]CAA0091404.1 Acireductone dioxygenase [Zhongshania aliphaticivorans]CAA0098790.1 Acireductone dioxygenase [Zhongshania aliphaticivorans]